MSLFLLVLGAVITVAGLILAASGVVLPEGTFSTEIVNPGAVAAVGGLLLVGLGMVVRQLQRIERALVARPLPRAAHPGEEPAAFGTKSAGATVRLAFPPKPLQSKSGPPPLPPAAMPISAAAEVPTAESLRVTAVAVAPLESASVVEDADVSLMPRMPTHAEEIIRTVKDGAVSGRGANGATPLRPVPRVAASVGQPAAPAQATGAAFNVFWPAKSRRGVQATSAHVAAPAPASILAPAPSEHDEAMPAATPAPEEPTPAAPVLVLKSGVVEGMAYTLYSDGSIEAELPQGTLRFGSIAALRNHIESAV